MMTKFCVSIDVEEWYMAENIRKFVSKENELEHTSFNQLKKLLTLLDEFDIKCTLFVVGTLLNNDQYVKLLRKAILNGHEIGSHTFSHKLLNDLDYKTTYDEILKNDQAIIAKLGVKPVGFRSPCFSTNIYLDTVLHELGYKYTSNSITASIHDRYGRGFTQKHNNKIPDLALPTFKIMRLNFPATGGGWFRLFPFWLQRFVTRKMDTIMFYCHPWDFDPYQPRLTNVSKSVWYRHTVNNATSFDKFKKFLRKDYKFVRGIDLIDGVS